ncbi:hypothetical protein MKW92_050082, partial [Papaver armeniacum]
MGNNNYKSLEQVVEALAKADLATSSRRSFNGRSLHQIGDAQNPYEQNVFNFREDKLPCSGLLEVLTRYRTIAPNLKLAGFNYLFHFFYLSQTNLICCNHRNGYGYCWKKNVGKHHVLLIISDARMTRSVDTDSGELSCFEQKTVDAIAKAREYSLSIIVVGVGDEPPSMVLSCRENSSLRAYDNFKYVNFTEIMSRDAHLSSTECWKNW